MIDRYLIIKNSKTNKSLVYYPVPKNGSTSAKMLLAKNLGIAAKFEYKDDIPKFKWKSEKNFDKPSISRLLPNKIRFSKIIADFKICIIRNPIDRFISAYENRLLFHKDNAYKNISIDSVIDELQKGNFENHFLPQSYFLGNNLRYFTNVYKINEMKLFEKKLNNFFSLKNKIQILQSKRNGRIKLLNNQIKKLEKVYKNDFTLLEKYY